MIIDHINDHNSTNIMCTAALRKRPRVRIPLKPRKHFSGLLCDCLNRNHNCYDHIFISITIVLMRIIILLLIITITMTMMMMMMIHWGVSNYVVMLR